MTLADTLRLAEIDHRIASCWSQQGPIKVYDDARELRRFLREAEAERDALLSQNNGEGHGKPCYYCGEPCNALAGNPSLWPVWLPHSDAPGVAKEHHIGCVVQRIEDRDRVVAEARREAIEECAKKICFGCREGLPITVQVVGNTSAIWHNGPGGSAIMQCNAEQILTLAKPEKEPKDQR